MAEMNALAPGAGGQAAPEAVPANPMEGPGAAPDPGAQPPQAPQSEMMAHFGGLQNQARARYDKMKEAAAKVGATRKALDGLAVLGDTVTSEDVVRAATGLVEAGIPAVNVAGILSEMPDGAAALQGWVQQKDQAVQMQEAQVTRALAITRHELAVTSLKHLMAHGAEQAAPQAPPQQTAQTDNPLENSNAG